MLRPIPTGSIRYKPENYRRADHRDRQHRAERHVRRRSVGKSDHPDRSRQQKQKPAGRFSAIDAPSEPGHRQRRKQSGKCARQTCRGFAHAKKFEANRGSPIIERRFLEPRLAVQTRRDPVACLRHVARDPRIARLVRTDEPDSSQVAEIADVQRGANQRSPADAGGNFLRIFHWNNVG